MGGYIGILDSGPVRSNICELSDEINCHFRMNQYSNQPEENILGSHLLIAGWSHPFMETTYLPLNTTTVLQ